MPNYRGVPIQILWGESFEKTITCATPLDAANAYPLPREGSEWAQASSGVEDAWITGDDEYLRGIVRWIPRADTPMPDGRVVTGWDGPNGWRAFLKWARRKNPFRVVRDWPNLLRNPGFEEGGDYWGVPLSTSWLGPGAGEEVEVVDTTGTGRTIQMLPRTPIADLGLTPGALASAACEAISESGGRATLGIAWEDATQNVIRYDTADSRTSSWQRLPVEARQVPEGTVSVRLYIQSRDLGTARFRDVTIGLGATAPPYHAAAVRHDPAGAHSGSRYIEVARSNTGQVLIDARNPDGSIRYFPVAPGDVVIYGGRIARISGDRQPRFRFATYADASEADPTYGSSAPVAVDKYTQSESTLVVGAGKTVLRFSVQVSAGGTSIVARFDDVYLKIAPAGDAPLDMYLVEPMRGEPELERDYTRRLELIMRTTDGSPVEGY